MRSIGIGIDDLSSDNVNILISIRNNLTEILRRPIAALLPNKEVTAIWENVMGRLSIIFASFLLKFVNRFSKFQSTLVPVYDLSF